MGTIFLLGLAAAVYPQLLAVVVVILTRPNPKPLLWACYLGSLAVNIGAGIAIFAVFRARGSIAGASSHRLGPSTYLIVGTVAVLLALFAASRRGRELIGSRRFPRLRSGTRGDPRRSTTVARMRSKADRALREGSILFALVVGALLGVPGPFDFLALGHLARSGDAAISAAALLVVFALIKFVLIEIPIIGYAVEPEGTADRVGRFSAWMNANKLMVVAAVVGVIGLALIGSGLSALG